MVRSKVFTVIAALAVSLAAGCASAGPVVHSPADVIGGAAYQRLGPDGSAIVAPGSNRHVIVISLDGLRPDAIDRYDADTLERLMREGRFSLTARTIDPSRTLPSHTSMLTGVTPEVHGITWNDNQVEELGRVPVPTVFRVARDHGLSTAAIASKGKLNHIFHPDDLDFYIAPGGNDSWGAGHTAGLVEDFFAKGHRPNLLFVHVREPDRYGHIFGWMGFMYGWAVQRADNAVEDILRAADAAYGTDGYTVIVTADHGGHGRDHGSTAEEDMTIPWIAWGRGVQATGPVDEAINTTDTAATALWLLGVETPETFAGRAVVGAFDAGVFARGGTPPAGSGSPAPAEPAAIAGVGSAATIEGGEPAATPTF